MAKKTKVVNNYVAKHNPHKGFAHKDRTKYDRKQKNKEIE